LERFEHRKEGSFRAWCLQIAQNLCLSRHRRRKGEPAPRELLSFEQLEEQLVAPEIGDEWGGLDSADQPKRLKSEREVAMQEAFATLNAVDQAVIEMKYITPTPDKQIAAIVQKPESQIPQIRYKANKKLRRAFERAVAGRRRKT
jgi:RNA polymerase sigma factor (sigma-70 family)